MNGTMRLHSVCISILIAAMMGPACWPRHGARPKTPSPENVVDYRTLFDDNGTVIKIGVTPLVTEQQLWATLRKAADDHQDDPGRDYIMLCCLWVEAYLVQDGKQSTVAAGIL